MEHFRHLANIGPHSLSYALRGTARDLESPLVFILTGITSSALEKSAGCRSIVSEARILLYERAGYGRSEGSSNDPDSLTVSDELSLIESRGSRTTVLGCRTLLGQNACPRVHRRPCRGRTLRTSPGGSSTGAYALRDVAGSQHRGRYSGPGLRGD